MGSVKQRAGRFAWTRLRWAAAGALAAIAVAAGAAAAARGPGPGQRLGDFFFGANLARAEVVLVVRGQVHDFRVDRGRIRAVGKNWIELRELDGTVVTVPVSPVAEILINGQPAPLAALRLGMTATTIRDGDVPAERVLVQGPRFR